MLSRSAYILLLTVAWSSAASSLSATESEKKQENLAMTANNDFGFDLYRQLAKASPGKNLFFSPYSMSSALTMAAEGARGKTAEQMGNTLRFPAAARRIGDDAQSRPWNTALIHAGLADMNRQFSSQEKTPQAVRDRIVQLKKDLAEIQKRVDDLENKDKYEDARTAAQAGHKIADELNSLLTQVDQYELRVASGLWGDKRYPFRPDFLKTLDAYYATGGIALMDFQNDSEAARQKINEWCEEQTKGRITDAMPKGSIDKATRLVLANAIYFLGQWAEPFDAKRTEDADFALNGKAPARVPMMHNSYTTTAYAAFNADGSFFDTPRMYDPKQRDPSKLYPDDRGFLMAEFAYKGGDLVMTVLVPRSPQGLGHVESLLTPDSLQQWLSRLQKRSVHVFLPKFKLQTAYEMKDSLKSLGMTLPFEAGKADFSGIATADEPLYLSAVIHKAFVEVNEKGTEAAAFTGLAMAKSAAPRQDSVPFIPEFKADRPFLFLIRDRKTGTILFLGRVENPQAEN
jgi:serine protease inhibitor